MPTQLRRLRSARGWSQGRLIHELTRASSDAGIAIMNPTSLRTALSRWENGHVEPDRLYRRLLSAVLGCEEDQLGFSSEHLLVNDELRQRLASSRLVDLGTVRLFKDQTETMRRIDRRLGAPAVIQASEAHVSSMTSLLAHAVKGSVREALGAAVADAAALAGWQALDVGALTRAWNHYETAKNAATTANDCGLLAHALGEQAYVLLDMGRPDDALIMATEARKAARTAVPGRLLSWLYSAEGEIAAAAGEKALCHRSLERAEHTLPPYPADDELPYLSLDAHHLERWRGSSLARLGDSEAITHLDSALGHLDAEFTRARGGLHVDLAQALTVTGEQDAAQEHLTNGRAIAEQTGSIRQLRRLTALAA